MLDNPYGTGAERQIAIYHKTGSLQAVTHYLMEQTMLGIPLETATEAQIGVG